MQGCVSQVWLSTHVDQSGGDAAPDLHRRQRRPYRPRPDRHPFALYSGKTADEIAVDAGQKLGLLLNEHLTPQRSNGLMAMVKRIRRDAETALGRNLN